MYKAIFYDLDNTLYNQFDDIQQRINFCCKKYNLNTDIANFWKNEWLDSGILKTDIIDKIINKFKIQTQKDLIIQCYRNYKTNIMLDKEIKSMLLEFKKQNILQFLITNGNRTTQTNKIKSLELHTIMNEVVIPTKEYQKPSNYWFEKLMIKYNLKPEVCIAIGDWYASEGIAAEKSKIKFLYLKNKIITETIGKKMNNVDNILVLKKEVFGE